MKRSRRRAELEFLAQLTDTALAVVDHVDLMRRVCSAAVPTLVNDQACVGGLGNGFDQVLDDR